MNNKTNNEISNNTKELDSTNRLNITNNEFKRLDPKARYSMITSSSIFLIILVIILSSIKYTLSYFNIPKPIIFWYNSLAIVSIFFQILFIILKPTIGYRRHKYRINKESIEKITGIFSISHEIIPIRRMQQINIEQGPINRFFNLSTIEIVTAGSSQSIDFLLIDDANKIAENLKSEINKFALHQIPNDVKDGNNYEQNK